MRSKSKKEDAKATVDNENGIKRQIILQIGGKSQFVFSDEENREIDKITIEYNGGQNIVAYDKEMLDEHKKECSKLLDSIDSTFEAFDCAIDHIYENFNNVFKNFDMLFGRYTKKKGKTKKEM
jgi:hypothetical protein